MESWLIGTHTTSSYIYDILFKYQTHYKALTNLFLKQNSWDNIGESGWCDIEISIIVFTWI